MSKLRDLFLCFLNDTDILSFLLKFIEYNQLYHKYVIPDYNEKFNDFPSIWILSSSLILSFGKQLMLHSWFWTTGSWSVRFSSSRKIDRTEFGRA